MKDTVSKIHRFNKPLLQDKIKLKYKLMSRSPYSFFRGTCHLFYDKLSKEKKLPFSPPVWTCGDLHLENFGSYKGENRLVYFDLNDFDEATLAPASWELTRFLTSIFIAFEALNIKEQKAMNMAALFLKTYSQTLAKGKSFYIEPKTAEGLVCDFLTSVSKRKQKYLVGKRTFKKGGRRLLRITKKQLPLDKEEKKKLCEHLNEWVINNSGRPYNYKVKDVVFRTPGLGSLGLKRYLFLLKSTNVKEKYLLVDMKQSRSSSLLPYVKLKQPPWQNESERIISVQQRMQNVSPFLLSTTTFNGDTFVLQELQPTKDSINFHLIKNNYRDMYRVINDMAILTASSQLRSASRQNAAGADDLIQFGQDESWQQQLVQLAFKYTTVVKSQYAAFRSHYQKQEATSKNGSRKPR